MPMRAFCQHDWHVVVYGSPVHETGGAVVLNAFADRVSADQHIDKLVRRDPATRTRQQFAVVVVRARDSQTARVALRGRTGYH
jgi:hypothetical protein